MFTHDEIWHAIDRLAAAHGYSASGLAKKAGLDPTTFNKSKRVSADGKPRWPSTESVAKILAVTGATMSELLSLSGGGGRTIPVLRLDQASGKGHFNQSGLPAGNGWDQADLVGNGAYALLVSDGSMEPHYREGDMLIVSPGAEVRRGDRVVARMKDGTVIVRELVRRTASAFELKPFDISRDNEELSGKEIDWIARITWASQ